MKSIMQRCVQLLLVIAGIAFSLPALAAYQFTIVEYPGAVSTSLWGITDAGKAVGNATFSDGSRTNFIYDVRRRTFAPVSAPEEIGLLGINASGVLAGGITTGGIESGIILDRRGSPTTFSNSDPDFPNTTARAIGKSGLVTGFSYHVNMDNPDPCLQFIDDVIGFIYDPASGNFTNFLPSRLTIAQGINGRGQVVGSTFVDAGGAYPGSPPGTYGFLRNTNGDITLFRVNNAPTRARGISDSGLITGFVGGRAFVTSLSAGPGYQALTIPLGDLLDVPDPRNNAGTVGQGINSAGVVSGAFSEDTGEVDLTCGPPGVPIIRNYGYIATPVPPKKK